MLHMNLPHILGTHLNQRQLLRDLITKVNPELLLLGMASWTSFAIHLNE